MPAWIVVTLALLVTCYVPGSECGCNNATWVSQQLDALLTQYEREDPPAAKVLLHLGLDVKHASILQQSGDMRLLADLRMTWEEPRLKWNATEWGCDSALTTHDRLWVPDVTLLNVAAAASQEGLRARLDAAGLVHHVTRLDLTAPLALHLAAWPHDRQAATFKFGSRTYGADELEILVDEFKQAVVVESNTWEIEGVSGTATTWQRGDDVASVAQWTVRVRRRAPALALGGGALVATATLLLLAATALPPLTRAPLAACASFIAGLWVTAALGRVGGGAEVPRVLRVVCALCVCGAGCAGGAALVSRLARCEAPPPQRLRTLLSSLSTLCRLTPQHESSSEGGQCAWAAAALVLDRACSAALLFTLLVLLAVLLF